RGGEGSPRIDGFFTVTACTPISNGLSVRAGAQTCLLKDPGSSAPRPLRQWWIGVAFATGTGHHRSDQSPRPSRCDGAFGENRMNDGENIDVARLQFEREKWAADLRLRERELDLREEEQRQARWRSPLTVAIFAAALAAAGNAVVAFVNGNSQRDLEDGKAESERILEMIKTGDPDSAADNLQFLLDSGLIADQTRVAKLASYLKTRGAGTGPA